LSRPRPSRRALVGVAAGVCAFAATAVLGVTRHGAAGVVRPGPGAGAPGPEGVPIPAAPSPPPARSVHAGQRIDGIACDASEKVAFHLHVHLSIVVRGHARRIPAGIGVGSPIEAEPTPAGQFVSGGSCFMWLHTHAADGIVHVESPVERIYTLGEFFDVWGEPLGGDRVGPARGRVTTVVDGRVVRRDPRGIALVAHRQIELEVGVPRVAADSIVFPDGL
jgi:hypothetical protein